MAKINTYQRRQLASSVTGVPAADASGQVIGKSMQNLGVALIKRQDALDTAKLSTAYYEYAAANNIASMTLRKKYQADTTLDPTTFDTEFKRGSAELALTFKENMSNRLHNRFDVLVSKADASQSVANNKWAFDQQNRNALTDFQNLNETSAVLAGDAMNPEDYLLGRAHYLDSAGAHQAIMTPVSYDRTIKSSLKQQAAMYWNNSVDYRNGGDPRALASSLKASPKFRETLQQDLGVKEFKRLEDKLGTAIKNMGMNEGFLKLADDNRELAAKVKKLYDPANDYGLKQVANDLEKEVNKRNYLTSINIDGSYNPSIAQIEENVKNLQVLKRIAATMNDASYSSNPEKKAELQAEIRVGMSPYGTDKFEKKLTKVKQDVAKQTAGQDTKGPWWSFISPIGRTEFVGRRIQALVTGVPEDIEAEALENIRANKNMTNYLEATQTLNGRILAAIDSRDLTYKDGMALVGKVGMLSTVEKYDSLTTKKRNWYTQGFDSFNAYARNLDLRLGTLENNRRFRDDIRTQMVEDLSVRVASYGDVPLTEEKIAGLISQIKYEKNQQIHPEIMGVKPGEYITINGQSVEFVGFSNNTGAVQIKSKALKKAVDNL